jgi:hypothetical protein
MRINNIKNNIYIIIIMQSTQNKWLVLLTTAVNNFDETEVNYRKTLYNNSIAMVK